MKFSKETAQAWRRNTIATIAKINRAVGNELTGENYYELKFRGKNHRPVLYWNNEVIASGITNINDVLYDTLKYYHMI